MIISDQPEKRRQENLFSFFSNFFLGSKTLEIYLLNGKPAEILL